MAWLQTSYLIAEILLFRSLGGCHGYFPLVGFLLIRGNIYFNEYRVWTCMEYSVMILFRALQGAAGASMIPLVSRRRLFITRVKSWGWLLR